MADPDSNDDDSTARADDDEPMDQDDKENDNKEGDDSRGNNEAEEGDHAKDDGDDSQDSDSDSSSSEGDSSSDDDSDDDEKPASQQVAAAPAAVGPDGHPLSAYELQRLERIRRNKEYLASLGLEKNKEAMAAKKPAKKPNPKSRKRPDIKRRSSISRASKEKAVTYSESTKDKEAASAGEKKEPWVRKKEHRAARMERFIHDEFRRIGKEQRRHLKRAKKNVRAADVEYRIAKQRAERYEKKRRKQLGYAQSAERMEEERRALGGYTAKEMLQEVDIRMYEIYQAIRMFDARFGEHPNSMAEWAKQQEENRRKMEIIDAMDRFPRALKDAVRDLDILLLERSPKDPPPPRRGTRKRKALDSTDGEETEPSAKMRALESPDGTKAKLAAGGAYGSLASAITAETLNATAKVHLDKPSPGAVLEESDSKPAAQEKPKKKKREVIPMRVGGWVSPAFSKDIDRSWLEADTTPKKFDPSSYIPQVGDTVLYYPAGHKKFLKVNPDVIGKKTRNVTRLTLWDRAKKEKAKLEKTEADEKAESKTSHDSGSKASTSKWWNEEWLSLIDGDMDRYPILCRVEKAHAEFPPDPYSENKIVTKDDEGGGVQVTWAVKKGVQTKKQTHPSLSLAVMLRPLTPVLPPHQRTEDNSADDDNLTPPPNFYVVTFPSKVSPFLVPFSWAYRMAHSLSDGTAIRLSSKPEWRGKVKNFRSLDGVPGSCRFDHKMNSIRDLCDALKCGPQSFAASLEQALASDGRAAIPITDACAVIERFEAALKASGACEDTDAAAASGNQQATAGRGTMMQLIRSTLPLWKEVVVESGSGKKLAMSAWELSSAESKSFAPSGPLLSISADIEPETGLVYIIDEPLRAKIECTIEDFLKDTPDAALFCPLVSDEEAPSYSCAVPRGMAFNKVLRRLRIGKKAGQARCYYRSIDSLLGDISAIVDNCVLYNSPDSFVVEKALEIVPSVKRLIAQVASSHFKEKEAREKSAEERRQAIIMQCNAPALLDDENQQTESKSRSRGSTKREGLPPPFTEFLHRSWIQDTEPDKSWDTTRKPHPVASRDEQPSSNEALGLGGWVPQSGDTIFYSRSLHTKFVKGHHPSLTTEQCTLPRFSGESDNTKQLKSDDVEAASETSLCDNLQNRWLVGKVVWVRAAFPRAPSKRDSDYENTFEVASPLLDLGIRFNYSWASNKIYKVSWRPCAFAKEQPLPSKATPSTTARGKRRGTRDSNDDDLSDAADDSTKPAACGKCDACHLNADSSFVRPAWIPIEPVSAGDEGDSSSPYLLPDGSLPADNMFSRPSGIPNELISSIDRCLNVLKRRCLDGVPAIHVDPRLTTENVKKGFCPPAAKAGKSLPTFDRVLAKGNSSGGGEASTRGVEKVDKRAVSLLADANYLPQWTSSLSEGAKEKTNRDGIAQSLAVHETLSPSPNFCLELIQTRLRNGYYRNIGSLAHDIQEAYVSSVILLLTKPATAKKGQAVSIRRIAKALSTTKDIISFAKSNAKKTAPSKEFVPSSKVGEKKVASSSASLSENEQKWVDKLFQVRKLYATALACAIQPDCVERIFGTVPRKKTGAVASKPKAVDEREQTFRKARNTLSFIYHSLQRDPCDNWPSSISWNPSFKVKVRFSGQESPSEGPPVEVAPADGAPVEVAQESPNEELSGNYDAENTPVLEVDTTKPIVIEASDYESNDTLVKFFFGRPGRMHSCGRCSAYGRSTMMCRVRKNHSKPDFDWLSVFQGTGGIRGLLHTLRTGQPPPQVAMAVNVTSHSQSQPPALLPSSDTTAANVSVSDNTNEPDPSALVEKALAAVSLADKVMEKAQKFSLDPVRLSEEFVRAYFPIDPEDGHYNYCILCGLIGDVICCEGCPNVVHPRCVNLADIPDEDWFCSKCRREGKDSGAEKKAGEESSGSPKPSGAAAASEAAVSTGTDELPASMSEPDGEAKESSDEKKASDESTESQKPSAAEAADADVLPLSMSAPYGLDDDADRLEAMLGELKSARPIRPKKQKQTSDKQKEGDSGDENDEDEDEPSSPSEKRPSLRSDDKGRSLSADEEGDDNDSSDDDVDISQVQRIRVGMKVMKKFGKHGYYTGTVLELPTSENPFYLVRYEDDDEEDMEEDELKKCILRARANQSRSKRSARRAKQQAEEEDDDDAEPKPSKRRGRRGRAQSSAVSEEAEATETKQAAGSRGRGRPTRTRASVPAEGSAGSGKKRGRPPKDDAGGPKKRGRPSKESPPKKRGRGRPRKRT